MVTAPTLEARAHSGPSYTTLLDSAAGRPAVAHPWRMARHSDGSLGPSLALHNFLTGVSPELSEEGFTLAARRQRPARDEGIGAFIRPDWFGTPVDR